MTNTIDWEAQFNPRQAVPTWETYSRRASKLNQIALQNHPDIKELRYGTGPLETLDFLQAKSQNRPLFFYIHGGYWRSRDKRDFAYIFDTFHHDDINIAIVNYDLCPNVTVEKICIEVSNALNWLTQQSESLGFDPHNIHACGHSAGAHILAMLLAQDNPICSITDGTICRAYLISGIYELSPVLKISVNQEIRLMESEVERLSPISYPVSTRTDCHIIVGGDEPEGWKEQSSLYAHHVRHQGGRASLIELSRHNHFSILEELQSADTDLARLIKKGISNQT